MSNGINLTEDTTQLLNLFDPTKGTSELYNGVHTFARGEIRPLDDIADREAHAFPHHMWKLLGDMNFKGIIVPENYNGLGLGYLALAAATMEISRAAGSIGLSFIADQALCTHQIIKHGTNGQQSEYLAKLASGEYIGALAMSEEGSGSDVMSMGTSARKVDGGWRLTGAKMWITNGGRIDPESRERVTADVMVCYAVTQAEPKRLTAFLVKGGSEGFSVGQKIEKEGMRGSETWEVVLDHCFVPDDMVLGGVHKGAHVLMAGLNAERLILGAGALGLAQAALEEAIAYTAGDGKGKTPREQFGQAVGHFQNRAHRFAELYSQLGAATTLLFTGAAMADSDPEAFSRNNALAASVFLQASKVATAITEENVYVHGGNGQTTEYRAGRLKRDASLYRIGGGSEDMRMLQIAREIIPGYAEFLAREQQLRKALAREPRALEATLQPQDSPGP